MDGTLCPYGQRLAQDAVRWDQEAHHAQRSEDDVIHRFNFQQWQLLTQHMRGCEVCCPESRWLPEIRVFRTTPPPTAETKLRRVK